MGVFRGVLLFLVALLGGWVPAIAQQPPSTPSRGQPQLAHRSPSVPGTPTGRVYVDVTVTDHAGKPIGGLAQQQFTLLDNKVPRPILSFQEAGQDMGQAAGAVNPHPSDQPVEVILLVDIANTSFQRIAYIRYQIDGFLRRDNGHLALPTTVMVFSDDGVKTQPRPSLDGNEIAKGLDGLEASLHTIPLRGAYDAMERLPLSLNALDLIAAAETRKPGRKLLLWIGTGWPMLESPNFQFSQKDRQSIFNSVVNTSRQLREARVTLYSLFTTDPDATDLFRNQYYQEFLKAPGSPKQAEPGDLSLPVLAVHSGGQALMTTSDLGNKLAQCFAEAKPYYTIGFDPPSAEHVDEYHAIGVKIGAPGVQARTVAGYYAQPRP